MQTPYGGVLCFDWFWQNVELWLNNMQHLLRLGPVAGLVLIKVILQLCGMTQVETYNTGTYFMMYISFRAVFVICL